MKITGLIFLMLFSTLTSASEVSPFVNLHEYLELIRYKNCDEFEPSQRVKIAIIENSFPDVKEYLGETLPEDVQILDAGSNMQSDAKHGLYVAQLVYLMTSRGGACPGLSPQIYLIPAFGFSAFTKAIDLAIQKKVDFILNNNVYEYHGFSDGRGFLNREVDRAIDAGIVWINAAGNFKTKVYQDYINTNEERWHTFAETKEDHLQLYCPKTPNNESCKVRLTLQWNDFKENINEASTKDLDLVVSDDADRIIVSSTRFQTDDEALLHQDPSFHTRYPYEVVEADLKPGLYLIKVKRQSDNFESDDEFRLILNSTFATFVKKDFYGKLFPLIDSFAEDVLPPADNPRVISVGSTDSEISSFSQDLRKPEFSLQSSLIREEGEYRGSSISASIFAALAVLIKNRFPEAPKEEIMDKVEKRFLRPSRCLYEVKHFNNPDLESFMNGFDSLVVYPHRLGTRILTPYDPYKYFGMPYSEDYILGLSPSGELVEVGQDQIFNYLSVGGIVIDHYRGYSICEE